MGKVRLHILFTHLLVETCKSKILQTQSCQTPLYLALVNKALTKDAAGPKRVKGVYEGLMLHSPLSSPMDKLDSVSW